MASRFSSGRPYTASSSSSGAVWSILYHFSNVAWSFRRKSAARSITLTPAASSSGAWAMATPCGVAKNTTSQLFRSALSGAENARSTRPRSDGNMSATGRPSSLREVIAVSSHVRVHGQQPQQFHARVSGAANDANFDHVLFLNNGRKVLLAGRRCILTAVGNRGGVTLCKAKKPPNLAADGFFGTAPGGAVQQRINASRIALRDVLCADQLFYARLHAHRG